jgi:hypothetical protein
MKSTPSNETDNYERKQDYESSTVDRNIEGIKIERNKRINKGRKRAF